ncbi:MAG: alpha-keto acid decarboxylase family protein [Candidatus Nitronauta litoralis]|uniref:Alpha-keto acid decarboxylase family protein n=1 Tax=Candidatus Nitronauta litoralis TaxID=2705533 RepID=A0A7T0FZV7_9BACT|nr:MAG: alpha-keto acid decarboxylase family protein [Candidatus Nitronauta litoralis]
MTTTVETCTIGNYLCNRLHQMGVTHIFGVPGDFSLKFCKLLEGDGRIQFVGTTREDTAGFAADGFARRHQGIGIVLVTHGVGALSTVNPIAGANAESSPVLVISGAPGLRERRENQLIHHNFGQNEAQKRIFENFTCCAVSLNDLSTAFKQIDLVLEKVWNNKKPGYLEIPRDLIEKEMPLHFDYEAFCSFEPSDTETLDEALSETVSLLKSAKTPAILAGVEIHRFGIQEDLLQLVEHSKIPVAATIMGKTVIDECHPSYLGIYQGKVGGEAVRQTIENADVLVTLGVMFTDINLGMFTARLNPNKMIRAHQGEVTIKHHRFPHITLCDFIRGLTRGLQETPSAGSSRKKPSGENGNLSHDKKKLDPLASLTTSGIIDILNTRMTPQISVVCDTGDCLFAAAELKVPDRSSFFASAFYTTMGFAVPAGLGVQCASPNVRLVILVGDGAFQMTGTELSTYKKLGFTPVVIIINNGGYETERVILDGAFNDIENWNYGEVCNLLQYGKGATTECVGDFEEALDRALADKTQMHVIDAVVSESSQGMRRLAEEIGRRI